MGKTPTSTGLEMGRARMVNVAAIEAELRSMWSAGKDEEQGGVTRACALNLIVVCEAGTHIADLPRLLVDITLDHPCRIFEVKLGADTAASEPQAVEAAVSAHCHRPAGSDRQVCCEQITLAAPASAAAELRSVLMPLLVTDLPVYVWWLGEPPLGQGRFRSLTQLADRVIVDSALGGRSLPVLAGLAEPGLQAAAGQGILGDLNWRRLWGWREALAGIFDSPQHRTHLRAARRLRLGADPVAHPEVAGQAFYLAAWLATRLGWTVRAATARRVEGGLVMELDAGTHVVELELRGGDGTPGCLSVEVDCRRDGSGWRASVSAAADGSGLECVIDDASGENRYTETAGGGDAALLMKRELELGGRDPVYESALAAAGQMVRLHLALHSAAED